jgi:hypothetical protein
VLESLITSKTRLRLLVRFFINVANQGYLRGLADEFNESTNAIRKELNNLTDSGYLHKITSGNKVQYQADPNHPLFLMLQKIIQKYIGIDALVAMVLERMGVVEKIIVIGDYAKGIDSGSIEVVVVGAQLNEEYLEQLAIKIEQQIERKVIFCFEDKYEGAGLLVYHQNSAI